MLGKEHSEIGASPYPSLEIYLYSFILTRKYKLIIKVM